MDLPDNITSFSNGVDLKNQRTVLDFLAALDVENSLHLLLPTIHDETTELEQYALYMLNYFNDEINLIISELAQVDPKLHKNLAETIIEKLKDKTQPIRVVIDLTIVTPDGEESQEIHEIISVWSVESNSYIIVQYFRNYDSLVSIATYDFMEPIPELKPAPVMVC